MKCLRTMLLSLSLVMLTGSLAFAQQTGGAPATGSSAPAGGAGSTTSTAPPSAGSTSSAGPTGPIDPSIDLPMDKPNLQGPQPPPTPPKEGPKDVPVQPKIYGHDLKSKNNTIFYVIDISGSMGYGVGQYTSVDGKTMTGCRLDRAKAQLQMSVASLPGNFKFNMLSYDCDVYQWMSQMVPADDANKQAAYVWINGLVPQGATGTGPATSSALSLKDNYLVVLLTDGEPNCGAGDESGDESCRQAHRAMIKQNNTNPAVINVFAIGATGNLEAFCQEVASDNNGTCTDVQ